MKPLPLCLGFWPHLKNPDRAFQDLQRRITEIINYTVFEILGLDSKDLKEAVRISTCIIL